MHLKQEERCPIKSKSHLQKFVLHLSVSVWHANASHFCFRFFTLCYSSLTLRELWHLAFSEIIFRKMPFFFVLLTENQCFHAMGRFVCPKKGCSLDLTFARMARFSTKAFLSQKSELETRKMVFHETYHVWKNNKGKRNVRYFQPQ